MLQIGSCAKQRSELTTRQRKGSLLIFQLNSTATSDGCTQKLGDNLFYDYESIATKVGSKIIAKQKKAIFKAM